MINPYDKFIAKCFACEGLFAKDHEAQTHCPKCKNQFAMNGTRNGGGWEKCHRQIRGIWDTLTDSQALNILDAVENFGYDETLYDAPRVCTECHANMKFLIGRFRRFHLTRCRDCGVDSIIPLNDSGHEITSLEKVLVYWIAKSLT